MVNTVNRIKLFQELQLNLSATTSPKLLFLISNTLLTNVNEESPVNHLSTDTVEDQSFIDRLHQHYTYKTRVYCQMSVKLILDLGIDHLKRRVVRLRTRWTMSLNEH